MPSPDPRRKPTALRVIEGNPSHRPLPKNEPKPEPRMPTCPSHLSAEGKREWGRIAPKLFSRGLLTEWDRASLAVYCEAVAQHARARLLLDAGLLVTSGQRDRGLVTNPAWRIFRDSAAIIRGFAQEFGLTPSARAGISMPEVDPDDPSIFTPRRVRGRVR